MSMIVDKVTIQIMGPGRLSFDAVTEIPEHLLKRSKAAKAKVEGAEAPSAAPAGDTPAPVAAAPAAAKAAAPAAPATPAAKPEPPVVAAGGTRKRPRVKRRADVAQVDEACG